MNAFIAFFFSYPLEGRNRELEQWSGGRGKLGYAPRGIKNGVRATRWERRSWTQRCDRSEHLIKHHLVQFCLANEMECLSNRHNPSHLTDKRNWGSEMLSLSHTALCNRIRMRNQPPAHIFVTHGNHPGNNERKPQSTEGHHTNCFHLAFFLLGMPHYTIPPRKLPQMKMPVGSYVIVAEFH